MSEYACPECTDKCGHTTDWEMEMTHAQKKTWLMKDEPEMCSYQRKQLTITVEDERGDVGIHMQSAYTSMRIQMSLNGMKISTKTEQQLMCIMKVLWIMGCYKYCRRTAVHVKCTCKSSRSDSLAHITCNKQHTSVKCSPEGWQGTFVIKHDRAVMDEKCTVQCSGEMTEVQLHADLHYVPMHMLGQMTNQMTAVPVSGQFDFMQFLQLGISHWMVGVVAIAGLLMMVLACCCVPLYAPVLLTLIDKAWNMWTRQKHSEKAHIL